jgi:hypothetical protein
VLRRARTLASAAPAALALVLGCVEIRTICPEGAEATRRILSGGAETEWCRRPDGVRQGAETRYYESGAKMIEGAYLDGVRHGEWRFYTSDSQLPWRRDRWADGALVSVQIEPRAAGQGGAPGDPLAPTQSGVIKLASADPLLGRSARDRELEQFAAFYPNGRPRVLGRYDADGLRTGTWRFWYDNGHLAREIDYDLGIRHRAFREWHEDGGPRTDGFYLDGERDGRWRRWDEAGGLLSDRTYDHAMLPP